MHCDIGPAIFQCGFQFLYEQALAADFGQGDIQYLIALCGHAEDTDLHFWV